MANKVLKNISLKLDYDFGKVGDKNVIKTKAISNISRLVSDNDLFSFAEALMSLQTHSAKVNKVEVSSLEN